MPKGVFDYSMWEPEGYYEKYADEMGLFGEWMIFGESRDCLRVDLINTGTQDDVIIHLPREIANSCITLRSQYIQDLKKLLNIRSECIA